jgi:hypothetical protein
LVGRARGGEAGLAVPDAQHHLRRAQPAQPAAPPLAGRGYLTGAKQFCAIRSYLSTATKHGMHFFDALVMLADGHPWMPATA